MEPIQIGNWLITEQAIEYVGHRTPAKHFIERDLIASRRADSQMNKYDWLLHYAAKSFLKPIDVYALNTAFIFA